MVLDFQAENRTFDTKTPFSGLDSDDILLTLGGKDLFGSVKASQIVGEKTGTGTISWTLPDTAAAAAFAQGVITLGRAADNQITIELADPAATDGLLPLDSPSRFKLENYNNANIELIDAWVSYQDGTNDRTLPEGTAALVLELTFTPGPNIGDGFSRLQTAENFLTRPDGVTVSATSSVFLLRSSKPLTTRLVYDIKRPVSGSYTLKFAPVNATESVQTIVLP